MAANDQVVDVGSLSDLSTAWCIHVAVTLRVAEIISAGETRIDAIAAAAACDAESLHRVLRHLVSKGVFAEPGPGEFALNAAARQLAEPGVRIGLDLDSFGGRMAHAWSSLLTAVRTGKPTYREVFGLPFWEDLDAHPSIGAKFDELMGVPGHGTPDPEILVSGSWDDVRVVVDVGGGTGALLAEMLRAHPTVRGTLVDLPRTVARADETFATAGVAERVSLCAQSFFEPLPAGADVYVLKNLLADWPDAEARGLLTRCAEAARPAGRVVVIGGVSPHEGDGPAPELLMMILVGGKSRTQAEFRALAASAGLAVTATGFQTSGRFVVECRPISI